MPEVHQQLVETDSILAQAVTGRDWAILGHALLPTSPDLDLYFNKISISESQYTKSEMYTLKYISCDEVLRGLGDSPPVPSLGVMASGLQSPLLSIDSLIL